MNNRLMGTLLTFVAVAAGLSFATPSHHDTHLKTDADTTEGVKTVQSLGTVKADGGSATGSASVTPAAKRWQSKTVTYKIASGTSYYKSVWGSAVKTWNRSGVVHLVPTSGKADITLSNSNSPQGSNSSTVGITYSSYYNNKTLNGLAVLASAKSYVYTNVANHYHYSKTERTNVAEHELGHALGLEHNVGKKSVMYYATRSQSVSKPDIKGLQHSYR
ncbi:matrixin family metalloprotease [Secundilactobacillus mixtipabuli]|uniref:Peptidase M10 metallopeptidase domain-containing protein n=1 Tax=Secundilactobacillus mixtipabuli TaxID=1435342 RepID=A0A1Z5I8P3_9LACO|nr:matrixin family metalloprotease [Secundilactobacillus mixtipabuli]GAW98124.1 hypothetical protein IWT30_00067 [Secundilactobacillus mixtipabuli]